MKFTFHPEAKLELNQAVDYYNNCQPSLGLDFLREIYISIQNILAYPQAWTQLSKSTRRCLVNRFPFGIIYQNNDNCIYIIAIMQLNRKPDYWQQRAAN